MNFANGTHFLTETDVRKQPFKGRGAPLTSRGGSSRGQPSQASPEATGPARNGPPAEAALPAASPDGLCKCSGHCTAPEHPRRGFTGSERCCPHVAEFSITLRGGKRAGSVVGFCKSCVCQKCNAALRRNSEYCGICHASVHGNRHAPRPRKRPCDSAAAERGSPRQDSKRQRQDDETMPVAIGRLAEEWRLVYLAREFYSDLLPCDLQYYFECASKIAFVFDLVVMALKEPWVVRAFLSKLPQRDRGSGGGPREAKRQTLPRVAKHLLLC